jgi:uncharacterized membrane protein
MFETIQEAAVCVVALLALAVGSIWYSPLVFGNLWQRVAGLSEKDLTYSKREFVGLILGVFGANIIVFSVVSYVLAVVPRSILSHGELALGLVVFVSALMMSMVVWEKRSLTYGLIHAGYTTLVIFLGVYTLQYWPW